MKNFHKKRFAAVAIIVTLATLVCAFSSCKKESKNSVTDVISLASEVLINGNAVDTPEADVGVFSGKQGDYIEFRFPEAQVFNTVFINEKTAAVRQYNIYAEIDGEYTLIHTGKHILGENITFDAVNATALKFEVVNTQINNDSFEIQGISVYNIVTD